MFGFIPEEEKKELILFSAIFASLIPMGILLGSHLMMGVAMTSFEPDDFAAFHPWMQVSILLAAICWTASLFIFWRLFKTDMSWVWGSISLLVQWIPLGFFWVGFGYYISDFF